MQNGKPAAPTTVVVVGDEDTEASLTRLQRQASIHGCSVGRVYSWPVAATQVAERLADVPGLVAALAQDSDVWLPFPQDLTGPLQVDVLAMALSWHGRRLLVGPHLAAWEPGAASPMSAALADSWNELHALAVAAAAAAASPTLIDEVVLHVLDRAPAAAVGSSPADCPSPRGRIRVGDLAACCSSILSLLRRIGRSGEAAPAAPHTSSPVSEECPASIANQTGPWDQSWDEL